MYNSYYRNGDVAQLARASGSYPAGRRFESHHRYQNKKSYKYWDINILYGFIFKKNGVKKEEKELIIRLLFYPVPKRYLKGEKNGIFYNFLFR